MDYSQLVRIRKKKVKNKLFEFTLSTSNSIEWTSHEAGLINTKLMHVLSEITVHEYQVTSKSLSIREELLNI